MKLRIVFLRVASPGNKIVAFYVRTLDIRKMEMFQFKFTRQKLAKVQYLILFWLKINKLEVIIPLLSHTLSA